MSERVETFVAFQSHILCVTFTIIDHFMIYLNQIVFIVIIINNYGSDRACLNC